MNTKLKKFTLALLCAGFLHFSAFATTDIDGLTDNSVETITTVKRYIAGANATKTGLTFSPSTTDGVLRYEGGNDYTLDSPTFSDGVTLQVAATDALTFAATNSAPSFTQSSARAYLTCDTTNTDIDWGTTAPTFTGSGWTEINANTTFTFGAAMTFASPIKIAAGVTLTIVGNYAINFSQLVSGSGILAYAGTGNLSFATSPTFATYSPSGASTLTLKSGVNFSSNITLGSDITIDVDTGASATISGIISGATYDVTKGSNNSTLILSGANTHAQTTLSGGYLKLGHNTALGSGTTVLTAGTLDFNVSGLVVANAFTLTSAIINVPSGYTSTLTGAVGSGSTGAVSKTGSGTLVLSSASNSPASWTFNGGTVNLRDATSLLGAPTTVSSATTLGFLSTNSAATPAFTLNAALTLNAGVNIIGTLAGIISGAGSVYVSGNGTINLNATNTYTGGLYITSGTAQLGNGSGNGASSIIASPNAKFMTNAATRIMTASTASTVAVY